MSIRRKEVFLTEATTLGTCQVRSKTERPCLHRAVVEIWGTSFCESCAREQEAYFAIGELTQGISSEPLGEALVRMRQESTSRRARAAPSRRGIARSRV